jgi:hypothetical protein
MAIVRIKTHRLSAVGVISLKHTFSYSINFFQGSTSLVVLGLLYEVPRSHSDAPHSLGHLWTSDRSVVEMSTLKRTTITSDWHYHQGFTTTSDIPHSVGHPWTSDRSVAETSIWQHTTLPRDKHPCPRRDSNAQPQQESSWRPMP